MATLADMKAAEDEIRAYRDKHKRLHECVGHIYNLIDSGDRAIPAETSVDVVIMGLNPGENPKHTDSVSPASKTRWRRLCEEFSEGGSWVMSELFFWSSNNLKILRQRVGKSEFDEDLQFCATLNKRLIAFHKPQIVFQPGLAWSGYAQKHYELEHVHTEKGKRRILIDHYTLPCGTPWLITPHWTASFGFSKENREAIKAYASAVKRPKPA